MENRYTTFTSIQLAGEETFIRWVLHGENEVQWNLLLEQNPELRNKTDEARHIVLSLTSTSSFTIPAPEASLLWNRIETSIKTANVKPKTIRLSPLWKWGLAAAASFAFIVWFNKITTKDQVYAQAGEKKEIKLTDESLVTLNAGSMISYKSASFNQDRVLRLDGEAFFKVKPGSTFTVKTDYGTVTVLGTSFNVISRDGIFEVNCYTGKVKVQTNKQKEVVITTGEASIENQYDQTLTKSVFLPGEAGPEWLNGKFIFKNQPFSRVISELERQYGIEVNLEKGLEYVPYTGLFESGDLSEALKLITWPLHLKSTVSGKTVNISS
jgi:ferric-dicitrate binding protein FerR (iron transport regulator)